MALQNANQLLQEASLLYERGFLPRAYFLAVASIEETGKALLAFDAQGRNLKDSAVTSKVRRALEDHSHKISSAFVPELLANPNDKDLVMSLTNLMVQLKSGREPSMYTDIEYGSSKVRNPSGIVRDIAASDCIRLAGRCFVSVSKHIVLKKPISRSRADDQFFTMKQELVREIFNSADFWWYYIDQLKSGKGDVATAIVDYRREFMLKGKIFKETFKAEPEG